MHTSKGTHKSYNNATLHNYKNATLQFAHLSNSQKYIGVSVKKLEY